jgi:LuxR family maltose regulon positive regulatory protein
VPKSTLLATKLHRPALPAKWVQRPDLIRHLNEGLELGRPLTLVSAPAGFGKTTCISEWVNSLDGWTVSWLSLDPSDDDPGRFFTYLLAALQKVSPDLGQKIEDVMRSGQLPPAEIISTILTNDILELEGRFLLVLDDFQVIQDAFILQVMENLVTNLPEPLRLVLLTREDPPLPLARLRANNHLTEIRAGDLRFNNRDANRFLNQVMGLSLSQTDMAALEDKTEGWIVGLQLAAIALRSTLSSRPISGQASPSGFIANLTGSHQFILSYLTEQVLDRQPDEIRDFLIQTSILDRLNADLCNAVTVRSDSRAKLDGLLNANLFLVPLDEEGGWYRYHHLFAGLLRTLQHTRQGSETAGLHRRACQWYAQTSGEPALPSGEREAFASQAIQHALAAGDYAAAVDLLEGHAMGMIMRGYAKTVNAWVQAIPEAWRPQSPRTHLALAWMHLLRGDYAQAALYLERLQGTLGVSGEGPLKGREGSALQAEWLVMQSLRLIMQGKLHESMAMANQALEITPAQENRVRSLAYYALASANRIIDDYAKAVEVYQKAIQYSRAAGNPVAEMMSTSGLAVMAFEHGQLHLASEIAAPVSERVERSGSPAPISALLYGVLAEVQYQWYRIEEARRHTLRALQLSTLGGYNTGIVFCRVLLSRLAQIEGDLETASVEIREATELLPAGAPGYIRQEVTAQQVCNYLARDLPEAAEMALQGHGFAFRERLVFPELPTGESISHSMGLLYNSGLRVLLYQARAGDDLNGLGMGIEFAGRLVDGALKDGYLPIALEALLLRAQMHALMGDHTTSQEDTIRALELGSPEGFIGVFVEQGQPVVEALAQLVRQDLLGDVQADHAERILDASSRSSVPGKTHGQRQAEIKPETLAESLTGRELEVLGLMAKGLMYKEIAGRLFISLNTVRFHVKAIYGKLNVNNRTQAIEVARKIGIL